eukprot:8783964-Alexandrium_andersonii.AAC.1
MFVTFVVGFKGQSDGPITFVRDPEDDSVAADCLRMHTLMVQRWARFFSLYRDAPEPAWEDCRQ